MDALMQFRSSFAEYSKIIEKHLFEKKRFKTLNTYEQIIQVPRTSRRQ